MFPTRIGTRVLIKNETNRKFCVLENTKYRYTDLAGGGIDPNETFEQCAYREVYEELGYAPDQPLQFLGTFNYQCSTLDEPFVLAGKLFYTRFITGLYTRPEKDYKIHWVTFDEMFQQVKYLKYVGLSRYAWKMFGFNIYDTDKLLTYNEVKWLTMPE